jgi:hypothetical protein
LAVSTIPLLKANLKTRLEARAGLSGVTISYGAPIPAPNEFVWLGDVENWEQEPATMNPVTRPRDETYVLKVLIMAYRDGSDQQIATERAFDFAEEIAADLRSDITVNGAVRGAQFAENYSNRVEEMASDTARACLLTVGVYCEARI